MTEVIFPIGQILIKKYELIIIYDKLKPSLSDNFDSDDNMTQYIKNNISDAFVSALKKYKDNTYILNVASTKNYGHITEDNYKRNVIIQKQLNIFSPIISKFMADVIIDNLYIWENGELVKQ